MGGIQPGGLNFDCKVRRESSEVADMFIAHIGKKLNFTFHMIVADIWLAKSDSTKGVYPLNIRIWDMSIVNTLKSKKNVCCGAVGFIVK